MFRFRSIESLLDKYKELENQEIYFAELKELNDPMEGFLDIYWEGDQIVWRNFIKHYLLCLEHVFSIITISKKNEIVNEKDIPIFKNHKKFLTKEHEKIVNEIVLSFFNQQYIKELLNHLSIDKTQIRREELISQLRLIHPSAIKVITKIYKEYKLVNDNLDFNILSFNKNNHVFLNLLDRLKKTKSKKLLNSVFSSTNKINIEADLKSSYKLKNNKIPQKFNFLFKEFPELFLTEMEAIIYPEWYTACFMSSCTNSSVWGNYGDKHKGVCLKFKTNEVTVKTYIKP